MQSKISAIFNQLNMVELYQLFLTMYDNTCTLLYWRYINAVTEKILIWELVLENIFSISVFWYSSDLCSTIFRVQEIQLLLISPLSSIYKILPFVMSIDFLWQLLYALCIILFVALNSQLNTVSLMPIFKGGFTWIVYYWQ